MKETIKGVLFDKDGTLLDAGSLWVPVGYAVADALARTHDINEESRAVVLKSMGVSGDRLIANSALASGTARDVAQAACRALRERQIPYEAETLSHDIQTVIEQSIPQNKHCIRPLGDLHRLFSFLRRRGIKIGLATSDLYETAMVCLKQLDILEFFDFVGADTGVERPKPAPDLLNRFCDTCGLRAEEVAMVGDSLVDVQMARGGGAGLAVVIGSQKLWDADYQLAGIDDLIAKNGRLIWA